jgi:hypothetical protein
MTVEAKDEISWLCSGSAAVTCDVSFCSRRCGSHSLAALRLDVCFSGRNSLERYRKVLPLSRRERTSLLSVPSDEFFGGRKGAQQMFIYQGAFKVVQRLSRGCPDNAARGYYLLEEGASRSDPERYCPPMIGHESDDHNGLNYPLAECSNIRIRKKKRAPP